MRSTVLAFAVACALMPSLAAADDDTPDLDGTPHIAIVGTAQTQVRPDLATITLGVTTERPSATATAAENARKTHAVIDAAKAAGVPAIDIATQTVTLTQTFDPIIDKNGRDVGRKSRGFSAENTLSIKVRDFDKVGTLAEDLIGKGANRFDGVQFSVEHPEPIIAELTGTAVRNAHGQAQAAADAANVRLGRVLFIEKQAEDGRPAYRRLRATSAEAAPSMPLEAGTSTFRTSVVVTWAIKPR